MNAPLKLLVIENVPAECRRVGSDAEPERFNRAMVGRDVDMVELKRQANPLSRELGREPPHALDFLKAPTAPPQKGGTP